MKIKLQTERLLIRELEEKDDLDLFEMDSDPDVHRFIENKPVQHIEEIRTVISRLKKQYQEFGIARWAVVDKYSNECVGWAGLKYIGEPINNRRNFYELGYRFKQKHWGKGFATESCRAILDYGFKNLPIQEIYAITHPQNLNSMNVLQKLGFEFKTTFDYDGDPTNWFELTKNNWDKL